MGQESGCGQQERATRAGNKSGQQERATGNTQQNTKNNNKIKRQRNRLLPPSPRRQHNLVIRLLIRVWTNILRYISKTKSGGKKKKIKK